MSNKYRFGLPFLAAFISFGLCISASNAQALDFEVERLTDNEIDDVLMDISEDWVVYHSSEDYAAGQTINLYDIATHQTIQLTSGNELSAGGDISEGVVVWQTFDRLDPALDGEIWAEVIDTGQRTRITDNEFNEYCAVIENGHVLWKRGINANSFELYLHELDSGVTTLLASASHVSCPSIKNGLAAWAEGSYPSAQIYLYELGTGLKKQISTGTHGSTNVWISERLVAWHQSYTAARSLLVYDLLDGSITSLYTQSGNNFAGTGVKVDGTRVVWFASGENDLSTAEIYFYDTDTKLVSQLTNNQHYDGWPDVSGEHVVWQQSHGHGKKYQIMHHDLTAGTTSVVASERYILQQPMVEKGNIAWRANPDLHNREVFLATPDFD